MKIEKKSIDFERLKYSNLQLENIRPKQSALSNKYESKNDNVVNTKIIEDFIYVPKILKKMRETETYAIYLI